MPTKPATPDDELSTLETADLARVTGGAGDAMSSMLPMMMMMMMRNRSAGAAAAAPPPAAVPPWQPTITVDGVPQQLTQSANGTFTTSSGG
jgi:hypothetical protein